MVVIKRRSGGGLVMVSPGLYEHFKGGLYQVTDIARDSESEQEMVVYRALYGDLGMWVRPVSMFTEKLECGGQVRPRFKRLEAQTGVLEVAYLDIKQGLEQEFEKAIERASTLIAASQGYISHQVKPCTENPSRYLLLVEWLSLEHHVDGFKQSSRYREWRQLLHDFYEPFPEVWHFKNA